MHLNYVSLKEDSLGLRCHLKSEGPSSNLGREIVVNICYLKFLWLMYVGFALSQATKALRESRGIALLYFRPLH